MENQELRFYSSDLTDAADTEAIRYLKQAIRDGRHWYIALLKAIGLWNSTEETHNGSTYRYLIAGESFDWVLLAGRLCDAVDGMLPDGEKTALLFDGRPPLRLEREEVRGLIGAVKYSQCLNYFYGITVEQALILAVQDDIRKEQRIMGYANHRDATNEAYRRVYGSTKAVLLKRFRREKGYHQLRSISLAMLKEFTYWLFKYRLANCDKTRVASDTKKALEKLSVMGFSPPW